MGLKMSYELTGVSPLLMHADDVELSDRVKEWQNAPENKDISVRGDDRSPAWLWHTYCYTDGRHITIPTDNISAAMLLAGATMILKGSKTYKEMSQTGLFLVEDHLPVLVHGAPIEVARIAELHDMSFAEQAQAVRELGFALFVKRAKVGSAKHVRVRPRFETWSVSGTLEILDKDLKPDTVRKMFEIAGFYKGLGDWRPSSPKRPGRFGRFEATLEVVK